MSNQSFLTYSQTYGGKTKVQFTDFHGDVCSLIHNGESTEKTINLGMNIVENIPTRMCLTQAMVAALLPALHHFVTTGELPVPSPADPKESVAETPADKITIDRKVLEVLVDSASHWVNSVKDYVINGSPSSLFLSWKHLPDNSPPTVVEIGRHLLSANRPEDGPTKTD